MSMFFIGELLSNYSFYDRSRFLNSSSRETLRCLVINKLGIGIIDKAKEKGWRTRLFIMLEKPLEISREKSLNYEVNLVFQLLLNLYLSLKSQSIYSYLLDISPTYLCILVAWWMTILFRYSFIPYNRSYLFWRWEEIIYDI